MHPQVSRVMRAVVTTLLAMALAAKSLAASSNTATIALERPLNAHDPGLAQVMSRLAKRIEAREPAQVPAQALDDELFVQLAAGQYRAARRTVAQLDALNPGGRLANRRWALYANAKLATAGSHGRFGDAFDREVKLALQRLDGKDAYTLLYSLGTPVDYLQANFDALIARDSASSRLKVTEATALVRSYATLAAFREVQPLVDPLTAADNARRYIVNTDVRVRTADGATICALVIRPRDTRPTPTLLNFTVYDDPGVKRDEAMRTAAAGYAAVIGFTRGKGCSPQAPEPMLHDGVDADALIEWIARQSWSDGRVGMFGGSYEGFTQWAAAKHAPKALKAIMPLVSFSPGVDFPMDGGVFMTYGLPWPLYTTDNKYLDDAAYFDPRRWNKLERDWYLSGRPYRELDQMAAVANPIWERWLSHPAYDAFWRNVKPTMAELANLHAAVLVVTGYYDSGQSGALSYWTRLVRARPRGRQYLVIGPWDHHSAQIGTISPLGMVSRTLRGLPLDPAGRMDIYALRYQWFDWIFGRGSKPALLADPVNFEVMGANQWRHVLSLEAMGRPRRYYLAASRMAKGYALAMRPQPAACVTQQIDFRDRSDVDRLAPGGPLVDQSLDDWPIVTPRLDLANSIVFATAPLARSMEVSGLFSADLDLTINKRDVDLAVTLFEITSRGEWIQLSYDWQRASYARNPGERLLLKPGIRSHLVLQARRTTSRLLGKGDRLAVVVGVIKQPGEEINYGSGRPVEDESAKDAGPSLQLRWWGDSWVDVPVHPTKKL